MRLLLCVNTCMAACVSKHDEGGEVGERERGSSVCGGYRGEGVMSVQCVHCLPACLLP